MNSDINSSEAQLDKLQRQAFNLLWNEANPLNGLVALNTAPDCPAGLSATGIALSALPVAVERGYVHRKAAAERAYNTLKFFKDCRHGLEPEATGYHGFYYDRLDMKKGRRARMSEISILENAIFLAGALTAGQYFDIDNSTETSIRNFSEELYLRADWKWALQNGSEFIHSWKPETGFTKGAGKGYDGMHLPYILALGSPTSPIAASSYSDWCDKFEYINSYGFDYLHAGPLVIHQLPHIWIGMKDIADKYMMDRNTDYFLNTNRAVNAQRGYAIHNPGNFAGYGKFIWGITSGDGPGPESIENTGHARQFLGHSERGVPFGPDDGTIYPWAIAASVPFAPDIAFSSIEHLLNASDLNILNSYGFKSSFNPSYPHKAHNPNGWISPWHYSFGQGMAMILIENYRSGLLWELNKKNAYIKKGLLEAGFSGGWLSLKTEQPEITGVHQMHEHY